MFNESNMIGYGGECLANINEMKRKTTATVSDRVQTPQKDQYQEKRPRKI